MTRTISHAAVIAILAAGASSRMRGRDKVLELVDGEPLLRRQARIALETGAAVLVALPAGHPARQAALAGLPVGLAPVEDPAKGMSASIRAALDRARGLSLAPKAGLMVLPADMPGFTTGALSAVLAEFAQAPDHILRATSSAGRPGHPTVFPQDLWPDLDKLTGDQGARGVITAHAARARLLALPGDMAIVDLDTPEDWAQWRRRNPS